MFYFVKCGIFVLNIESDKNAADLIYFIRSNYCSVSVFTCNSVSLELPPTIISKFPAKVRIVLVCVSHHSSCLGVNSNSTLTVFPAGICTRLKARSVLTGPSASSCFSDIPVLLLPRHDYRYWLQEQ